MPGSTRKYYWDSNVFIALISNLQTPLAIERRWHCERFFGEAMLGEARIYTSSLTVVEVVRAEVEGVPPAIIPADIRQKISDLFDEPYITLIPLDAARLLAQESYVGSIPGFTQRMLFK